MKTGDLLRQYRLGRVLGQGGMGIVYEAQDENSGRTVVVKTLLQSAPGADALRRFEREGGAAAAVTHENVARVLDAGAAGGTPYLVFEHVAGGALDRRLKKDGPLPWREAARLGAGIARGLAAIHAAGLVHRDMKPANVLLTPDGQPRIADLGLVRADAASGLTRGDLTKSNTMMGTLEYIAPEQTESARDVDARADLYSLGATLHALVSGRPPFDGTGIMLVKKHLMDPPPRLSVSAPDVDPGLEALVLRLLAKAPADRPQTAAEVAAELDAIVAGTAEAPPRSRAGLAAGLVAVVLAAGLGVGAWLALRETDPVAPPTQAEPTKTKTPASGLPAAVAEPRKETTVAPGPRWTPDEGQNIPIRGLAVTSDGKWVVSGGYGVSIWTPEGKGHAGPAGSEFAPVLDLRLDRRDVAYTAHGFAVNSEPIRRWVLLKEPSPIDIDKPWDRTEADGAPGVNIRLPGSTSLDVRADAEGFQVVVMRDGRFHTRRALEQSYALIDESAGKGRVARWVNAGTLAELVGEELWLQPVMTPCPPPQAKVRIAGAVQLEVAPAGDAVYVGGDRGEVWRIGLVPDGLGARPRPKKVQASAVLRIAISPDGALGLSLAEGKGPDAVRLWRTIDLAVEATVPLDPRETPTSIAWAPGSSWFVVGLASGAIQRFEVARPAR